MSKSKSIFIAKTSDGRSAGAFQKRSDAKKFAKAFENQNGQKVKVVKITVKEE